MKKILFVAMPDSIHTARWLNQLMDTGWEIHLFPVYNGTLRKEMGPVIFHPNPLNRPAPPADTEEREEALAYLIRELHPDCVHSLETQKAGYITMSAKKRYRGKFPLWLHTLWGSDIYLFGRIGEHHDRIREVMAHCDYLSCEGKRDEKLAREFGFGGAFFPIVHAAGGFDFERIRNDIEYISPSRRKVIMVKGYQGWAGRALVAVWALQQCVDLLNGYEIVFFSANRPEMKISIELFTQETGIPTQILHHQTPHPEMLRYYGRARCFIGLSISDGLPSSLLEAMVMGAFPIQSWTSCSDEWIEDGKNGFLVPPEDTGPVTEALRRALTEDRLVDDAAALNARITEEKMKYRQVQASVIDNYNNVYRELKNKIT